MKITDSNLTLKVLDMDTSIAFYTSIGFTLKNRWGNYYAQVAVQGMTIGLHPVNDAPPANHPEKYSIGLTADDFNEAKELLGELSILFSERNEEGGQFLHFHDPDGTALYFIKPKSW